MKQLEIPFEFKKEENKAIFGGCTAFGSKRWITLDDTNTLRKRTKHILIFNVRACQLDFDGDNAKFLFCDTTELKPSIYNYLLLASYLKKKGYRFNKKLSTIEKMLKND